MKRSSKGLVASLLAAIVLSACSAGSGSSLGNGDFLTDGHAVVSALDAIAAKSGTPMRVTTVGADVAAPDGAIAGPTPAKLMSLDAEMRY